MRTVRACDEDLGFSGPTAEQILRWNRGGLDQLSGCPIPKQGNPISEQEALADGLQSPLTFIE